MSTPAGIRDDWLTIDLAVAGAQTVATSPAAPAQRRTGTICCTGAPANAVTHSDRSCRNSGSCGALELQQRRQRPHR